MKEVTLNSNDISEFAWFGESILTDKEKVVFVAKREVATDKDFLVFEYVPEMRVLVIVNLFTEEQLVSVLNDYSKDERFIIKTKDKKWIYDQGDIKSISKYYPEYKLLMSARNTSNTVIKESEYIIRCIYNTSSEEEDTKIVTADAMRDISFKADLPNYMEEIKDAAKEGLTEVTILKSRLFTLSEEQLNIFTEAGYDIRVTMHEDGTYSTTVSWENGKATNGKINYIYPEGNPILNYGIS